MIFYASLFLDQSISATTDVLPLLLSSTNRTHCCHPDFPIATLAWPWHWCHAKNAYFQRCVFWASHPFNLQFVLYFSKFGLDSEKKGFSSICTTSLKNISGCLWFCMSCRCWSCVVLVVAVVAGRSYETFRANIAAVPGGRTSSFEKAPIVLMSTARDSKPWSLAQQKNGTYVCHMSILYWCHFVIVWHTKCENIPLYCKTCGFFQHSCWSFMPATAISITPGTSSFTVLNLPAGRTCSTRQAAGVVSPA